MFSALIHPSTARSCALLGVFVLCACPVESEPNIDDPSGTEGFETEGDPDPSATSTPTPMTDTDPVPGTSTTGLDTEGDTEDCSFIGCGDVPPQIGECDLWAQDCDAGEKCNPFANDGGNAWNSSKCVPLDSQPDQPGDPCTVEGSGVSGFDSCDIASMCWNVDGETNTGTCVPFCTGSDANPTCDNPADTCIIANDGFLILCLPSCNPLLQDCPDGEACYPAGDDFACAPVATTEGDYGAPCEFTNACQPGLLCAGAQAVPDCVGSMGCCTEFCDLSGPDPSMTCAGFDGGQECIAAFPEGDVPPGLEDVGFCSIPE